MKKAKWTRAFTLGAVSLAVMASPELSEASKYRENLGVGLTLGEPTGVTARKWVNESHAYSGSLAYSFDDFLIINSDYILYVSGLFNRMSSEFTRDLYPTAGIGAVLVLADDRSGIGDQVDDFGDGLGVGIRIPLGAEWRPRNTRIGVSLELAPGVAVVPGTFFFMQGGLGIRYYF